MTTTRHEPADVTIVCKCHKCDIVLRESAAEFEHVGMHIHWVRGVLGGPVAENANCYISHVETQDRKGES